MSARLRRSMLVGAAVSAAALGTACVDVGTAVAAPSAAGAGGSQSVIVVLRNQLASTPANKAHVRARKTQATSDQDAVLGRVSRAGGAKPSKIHHYTAANAFSATVTSGQAAALAADPSVAAVIPNHQIAFTVPTRAPETTGQVQPGRTIGVPPSTAVCPTDPSKPLLEPEALQDTNTASDDPSAKTAQQLTRAPASRSPSSPTRSTPTTRTSSAPMAPTSSPTTRRSPPTGRPRTRAVPRLTATRPRSPRRAWSRTTCRPSSTPPTRCPPGATSVSWAWRPGPASWR